VISLASAFFEFNIFSGFFLEGHFRGWFFFFLQDVHFVLHATSFFFSLALALALARRCSFLEAYISCMACLRFFSCRTTLSSFPYPACVSDFFPGGFFFCIESSFV
jgi:hypothetical protein